MTSFSGTFSGTFDFKEKSERAKTFCASSLVLLRFRIFYAFVEAAALRSIVLRYAVGAPIATRVSFFLFPFVCLEMSLFPSICCTIPALSLYGGYVVRSFLPNGVFLPCGQGLDF